MSFSLESFLSSYNNINKLAESIRRFGLPQSIKEIKSGGGGEGSRFHAVYIFKSGEGDKGSRFHAIYIFCRE